MNYSKAVELTRVATAESEQQLVEFAKSHSARDVRRMVRCLKRPTSDDALTAFERRSLDCFWDEGG